MGRLLTNRPHLPMGRKDGTLSYFSKNLRAAVRADLVRVAEHFGRERDEAPTIMEYQSEGRFGTRMLRTMANRGTFMHSWTKAMGFFMLKPARKKSHPTLKQVQADVYRVSSLFARERPETVDLGIPGGKMPMPTYTFYKERGKYSPSTVQAACASMLEDETRDSLLWERCALVLGLSLEYMRPSKDRIMQRFRFAISSLGLKQGQHGPSFRSVQKRLGVGRDVVDKHFGSYGGLVRAAGLVPKNGGSVPRVTREAQLERLHEVARQLGIKPGEPGPRYADFRRLHGHAFKIISRDFGGYDQYVLEAGYAPQRKWKSAPK